MLLWGIKCNTLSLLDKILDICLILVLNSIEWALFCLLANKKQIRSIVNLKFAKSVV